MPLRSIWKRTLHVVVKRSSDVQGVTVVADLELALLREVEMVAATDGDVVAAVDKLKAFYRMRASASGSTEFVGQPE